MNDITISKDAAQKKINVVRLFNAPVEKVWKAWTDRTLLDRWWGPKPYHAETREMNFTAGGCWLYAMVGPENFKHWNKVSYKTVDTMHGFEADSIFCDEAGNIDAGFPVMHWLVRFSAEEQKTAVHVTITFDDTAGFDKIIQMGFEAGFTQGLNQLEELV